MAPTRNAHSRHLLEAWPTALRVADAERMAAPVFGLEAGGARRLRVWLPDAVDGARGAP